MALKTALQDREYEKFVALDDGNTAVRVKGTQAPSGISGGGIITHVTLNSSAWTPLPATALVGRVSILVQNISGNGGVVLWNYSNTAPADEGIQIADGASKTADLSDAYIIYGRMLAGSGEVAVDEVS